MVIAPILLLMFVLPLMIGGRYRSWGLDVAKAWWDKREWYDFFASFYFLINIIIGFYQLINI
jgi:hypothetical protein